MKDSSISKNHEFKRGDNGEIYAMRLKDGKGYNISLLDKDVAKKIERQVYQEERG
jgi:hypothetical protein